MRTLLPVTFDASLKTITFTSLVSIELKRVLLVVNVTDGIQIFNGLNPAKGGAVATNVLTLEYDTTSMDDADVIQAWYEVDDVNGTVSDAAVVTNTTGTISGKLRGLVSIFADVWDSSNHWLNVSLKSKIAAVLDGKENDSIGSAPFRRSDSFNVDYTGDPSTVDVVRAGAAGRQDHITDVTISTDTAATITIQTEDDEVLIGPLHLPENATFGKSYLTPIQVPTDKDIEVISDTPASVSVNLGGYGKDVSTVS